jgi:hypothetical protein
VLRAAAPSRRRRWKPPSFVAPRLWDELEELAATRRDDLLSTRMSAAWEESWDAGMRQGVTYHHPLWNAQVVEFVRGLPLEALVAHGQAKSPARSYLARRIPSIVGHWPRPGVADSLLAGFETEPAMSSMDCLLELGVVGGPAFAAKSVRTRTKPLPAPLIALEQWLRSRV